MVLSYVWISVTEAMALNSVVKASILLGTISVFKASRFSFISCKLLIAWARLMQASLSFPLINRHCLLLYILGMQWCGRVKHQQISYSFCQGFISAQLPCPRHELWLPPCSWTGEHALAAPPSLPVLASRTASIDPRAQPLEYPSPMHAGY